MEEFPIQVEEFPFLPVAPDEHQDSSPFNKRSLLKNSATIAISGELSLVERRVYNVLYAHAYDRMDSGQIHQIDASEIFHALDNTLERYEDLRAVLEKLISVQVRYNIFKKDRIKDWGSAALLGAATLNMETGKCTYEFPAHLKQWLNQPPYANIPLRNQTRLNSSHALTLYEFCVDYYDARRGYGETAWISLAEFQELLGTNYKAGRDIRRYLIELSLEKIMEIQQDFTVEYRLRKSGKSFTAVKFVMTKKNAEPETPKGVQIQAFDAGFGTTFEEIFVGTIYRIIGGTDDTFRKISPSEAFHMRTRKTITMQNLKVPVSIINTTKH